MLESWCCLCGQQSGNLAATGAQAMADLMSSGYLTGQCAALAVQCCGQQGPGVQWGHSAPVSACSATCSDGDLPGWQL